MRIRRPGVYVHVGVANMQIRPGFDEELDRMKNVLDDLPDILQSVGKASVTMRAHVYCSCRLEYLVVESGG